MLTLSSSTESEGENGQAAAGQAQGTANDSDDIQTISSGSEEEEGDDKKNALSGSGERRIRDVLAGNQREGPGRPRQPRARCVPLPSLGRGLAESELQSSGLRSEMLVVKKKLFTVGLRPHWVGHKAGGAPGGG